jgi:hypothetical protein
MNRRKSELEEILEEKRINIIAQNGNDGLHYDEDAKEQEVVFDWVTDNTHPKSYKDEGREFDDVITKTLEDLKEILTIKGKEYRRNGNVYHNFDEGSAIKGISREKVLDGFLLKHEISISDMTNDLDVGILPTREKVEEKFNDNLIYLLIKKAMILSRIN